MRAAVVGGLLGAVAVSAGKTLPSITDADRAEFAKWMVQYGKQYPQNFEEDRRVQNYVVNRGKAAELNAQNPLATFGMNEFADLSEEEFSVYHNAGPFYAQPHDPSAKQHPLYSQEEVSKALASDIDWVSKGAVTAVKNQGSCGSCWAFSATGNIEGQWFLAGNKLVSVSEQQLVDCDHMGDKGCQGGLPENAFKYVQAKGLESEQTYPYTGFGGTCQGESKPAVHTTGLTMITKNNEGQMLTFLQQKGPIAIGVDASQFQMYGGGILTSCTAGELDHGVLVVGYGANGGQPYWKIKNSWGAGWGEEGYIRVSYGKNSCGMSEDPTSTVVGPPGPSPPAPTPGPTPPAPPSPPTPPAPPSPPPSPPTPPSPPSPPMPGNCEMQDDQASCLSTTKGGKVCQWCVLSAIHIGICENPEDACDGTGKAVVV